MLQYLRRRPKQRRGKTATTNPIEVPGSEPSPDKPEARISLEPSETPEANDISSEARAWYSKAQPWSGENYNPDRPPHCRVCWDFEAAASPIQIKLPRLRSLLRDSCAACHMLYNVLQPWREEIEKLGAFSIEFDSLTVNIHLYEISGVGEIQLYASDGK